jgi:glycosyltransferase involved in cell wall biosynthesis
VKHVTFILTNDFFPDVRVYKEAKYLVERGFNATILCWHRDVSRELPEHEILDGIELIRYKIPSVYGTGIKQLGAYWKYIKKCKYYLKSHNTDYLHCNDIDGVVAGFLANKKKVPFVFDMHEFYEKGSSFQRGIIRAVVKFFLRRSIAGLYENAVYLTDDYKSVRSKLHPLRNYPDATMVQYLPKTESPLFRVAYHGVVRQYEEFIALFEAVKDMPDVRVDINGSGMTVTALKEREKEYSNVYVNGPYNGITESTRLYSETDALFCGYDASDPNYHGDAEAIKFYEAICTGTPMIMTAGIGMAEKIEKNHFGVTCDTRSAESIKRAIQLLKNDKNLWNQFHECELSAASNYTWESAVKVLERIYR